MISAFSLHLVKTGRVPVELGRALNKVEEIRLVADYKGDPVDQEHAAWDSRFNLVLRACPGLSQ